MKCVREKQSGRISVDTCDAAFLPFTELLISTNVHLKVGVIKFATECDIMLITSNNVASGQPSGLPVVVRRCPLCTSLITLLIVCLLSGGN